MMCSCLDDQWLSPCFALSSEVAHYLKPALALMMRSSFSYLGQLRDFYTTITKCEHSFMHACSSRQHYIMMLTLNMIICVNCYYFVFWNIYLIFLKGSKMSAYVSMIKNAVIKWWPIYNTANQSTTNLYPITLLTSKILDPLLNLLDNVNWWFHKKTQSSY